MNIVYNKVTGEIRYQIKTTRDVSTFLQHDEDYIVLDTPIEINENTIVDIDTKTITIKTDETDYGVYHNPNKQ